MNQDLKENLAQLPTNLSTWVATVLMGVVYYWLQLSPADQQTLMAAYPWLKHFAPLTGLLAYLGARVVPQGRPRLSRAYQDTRPMGRE